MPTLVFSVCISTAVATPRQLHISVMMLYAALYQRVPTFISLGTCAQKGQRLPSLTPPCVVGTERAMFTLCHSRDFGTVSCICDRDSSRPQLV